MKLNFLKPLSISKLLQKTGKGPSSPGTVSYVGAKREDSVLLRTITYNASFIREELSSSLAADASPGNGDSIRWIHVSGVHNEEIVKNIGEKFAIHPLTLEDISNTTQRPKFEEYDEYIFIVLTSAALKPQNGELFLEQFSLLAGEGWVLSFQEHDSGILDGLYARLHAGRGRGRKLGADYLLYAIADAVVDNYFQTLAKIAERMESLEEELMASPGRELLNEIYSLRQHLVFLRRAVWPMRETINSFLRAEPGIIKESTFVFIRDLYDHSIQVLETLDIFREMVSGMLELYLTLVNNKMNEVMKVLTVFAAIFIPLTFFSGIYGMNFKFMPEMGWKYSYAAWWFVAIASAVLMLWVFKKKKWL